MRRTGQEVLAFFIPVFTYFQPIPTPYLRQISDHGIDLTNLFLESMLWDRKLVP